METYQTTSNISEINGLFNLWQKRYPGRTKDEFYMWLSTPSYEKELFLAEYTAVTEIIKGKIIIKERSIK